MTTTIQAAAVASHETDSSIVIRFWLSYFAIYILWGSTFLAIRVAVATVPPLFAAGVRFAIAGATLYAWVRARSSPAPTKDEWRNLTILGALMFLAAYSGLLWAEKIIPSGIASMFVATIPAWTALLEMFVLKRQPVRGVVMAGIAIGFLGVVLLAFDPSDRGATLLPCLVVMGSASAWSLGTVLTTRMKLPASKAMCAAAPMLTGGIMLLICSALIGEIPPVPHLSATAAIAIAYLIIAGSLVAFTAYQWLLTRVSSTAVTSYAYVNPIVALAIGYWLGDEPIGPRTIAGSALVLASVVTLLGSGRR
jgi:drug/metabolite transporter (DMT)-like permease